jgi:exosome complex component RRP46
VKQKQKNKKQKILAASLNAACLALIDAGVSLTSFVVASSCCILPNSQELVVDPTLEEQQRADSVFTLAFDGALKDLVMSESHGEFSQKKVCLLLCSLLVLFFA